MDDSGDVTRGDGSTQLKFSMVAFENLLERLSYFWNYILCDNTSTFFRECTATGGTSYHAPANGRK